MKITFEYWVNDNIKTESSKQILLESIVCYKASAYRAALMLSYIAFTDIVKNRLLMSKRPPDVVEGEWNIKRNLLTDYDQCDKTVFDLLNRGDCKYFKLSDSIRNQIRYWKDRRNDCAHLKDNLIDQSHVESFWLFLQSNLNKFTVNGSGDDLLSRIDKHFNEDITPFNEDFSSLVLEIPNSIDLIDFEDFLLKLKETFKNIVDRFWLYSGDDAGFFHEMLNNLEGSYYEITKNFIINDLELSKEMLSVCPVFLTHYTKDNPGYVREMWRTYSTKYFGARFACELLRNSIIPKKQIEEFITKFVHENNDSIPKEDEIEFLELYGYTSKVENIIIESLTDKESFKWWIEANKKFINFYIKLSFKNRKNEFVEVLLKNYNKTNVSDNAKVIYSSFIELINENSDVREYIKAVALEKHINIKEIISI